jgi:hypothetical protein
MRVRAVVDARKHGLPLRMAIDRARRVGAEPRRSVYAALPESFPQLRPQPLSKRALVCLSRAIEDEACIRAERPPRDELRIALALSELWAGRPNNPLVSRLATPGTVDPRAKRWYKPWRAVHRSFIYDGRSAPKRERRRHRADVNCDGRPCFRQFHNSAWCPPRAWDGESRVQQGYAGCAPRPATPKRWPSAWYGITAVARS